MNCSLASTTSYLYFYLEDQKRTASLISSLCSSVNRFNGFVSGPADAPGAVVCVDFGPALTAPSAKSGGPVVGPGPVVAMPRRENVEALNGRALALALAFIDRSGSFPAYDREPNG